VNTVERDIARAIERQVENAVPDDTDLWPVIERRLGEPNHAWHRAKPIQRRTLFIAALVALCMVALSMVTAVAVPPVRAAWTAKLTTLTGGQQQRHSSISSRPAAGGGQVIGVDPTSNVIVLSPGYVPEGLTIYEVADIPRRPPPSPGQHVVVVPHTAILVAGPASSQPTRPSDAALAAVSSLGKAGVDVVYMRYSSPTSGDYVEVIETASWAGQPQVEGESIIVTGSPAQLQESGGQTAVKLIRGRTVVTVRTNLGREQTLKVAENFKSG